MKTNTSSAHQLSNRLWAVAFGVLLALSVVSSASAGDFVGSVTCAECHSDKIALLEQSIHSKMIRPNSHLPGVIHGDLRQPKAPRLPVAKSPTNDVHWVMGGHYKEESYIRTNWTGSNIAYRVTEFEWNPIAGTYATTRMLAATGWSDAPAAIPLATTRPIAPLPS